MPTVKKLLCIVVLFVSLIGSLANLRAQALPNLDSLLTAERTKYDLPAIGVAVIRNGKLERICVTGVRKYGDTTKVTINDKWHIGSDTKSMTATLLGRLVEMGKVKWSTTLVEVFPELKGKMHREYDSVTLEMLLCHHAGLPAETCPKSLTPDSLQNLPGTPREQRYQYLKAILAEAPEAAPGSKYIYANSGFAIAGAIAERLLNKPYEELLYQYVFSPLGISSAGFGSMNTPGLVNQPWQHVIAENQHVAIDGGRKSDNPEAITPAGRVHLTLGDWSKYAIAHLVGETDGGVLQPATFKKLHSLPFGGEYGFGWGIVYRPWAKSAEFTSTGKVLAHDGSNQQNYASIWLAPDTKFGLLVVTNQGGDMAEKAVQEIVGKIIKALWVK
jgi:CubicO group peptidase (beta-lactamase class C family)